MIARTLRVQIPPDRIDALLRAYREDVRPIHATAEGLRQHYILVNRETGWIEIIGVWDSAEDIARVAPVLEPARQRLWAQLGPNPPLDLFDVGDELVRAS